MSNPISANNTLNKISNPNDDQLHRRHSTTVRNKEKHLRYTPYTTTRQIFTNDHCNSIQYQTNLSQRQMEINYPPFNRLNPPYFLQNTYDDSPRVRSNIFETMHPYFSDAGIISQPQSYEESNKLAPYSTSTNIRKKPESQVVVNSGARAERTEQVKDPFLFSNTQYSQRAGYFQVERYTFYDQHQLSEPKSDKKKRNINDEKSLWKFILHNIIDNRDSSISWVNIRQGIFEFKDLDKFSEQWTTHRKRTTPIIFENIARSIRNYYTTGIMTKFDQYGIRLPRQHYRFNLSNPVVADYFKTIGLIP
ncbi:ETS domain-containing protein [Endozoicomonas acroporae]|uniref:ETS domain-containing protein n=1 Tax=Endozoicomonas acroporae TaxID=1701104 RepID=UPI000C774362|nr:ETS domain-containing protein [Endozoicomonas acroporae]